MPAVTNVTNGRLGSPGPTEASAAHVEKHMVHLEGGGIDVGAADAARRLLLRQRILAQRLPQPPTNRLVAIIYYT